MRLHQLFSMLWIRWFCGIVLVFSAFSVMYAQSPTAPTASEEPAKIDQIWLKASSKYDPQRAALLKEVDAVDYQGPFRPDWESLQKYEAPQRYQDAKFGIFIHRGAYSVPAFGNEWYPRNMYEPGFDAYKHHIATYGPQDKFGYKDFIPMFKAEHFDPSAWAELFKKAGAKYVVPVAEHHDGFAMYDSGVSDWTAAKMGPHRDIIGDLAKAMRAEGLHFGMSSHRVEHDFFMGVGRKIPSDVNDPEYAAFYGPAQPGVYQWGTPVGSDFTYVSSAWTDDWLARGAELVEKYHPDIMYFDWWIGQASIRPNLTRFAAFYYNRSLKYGDHVGVINYKDFVMQEHSAVLDLEPTLYLPDSPAWYDFWTGATVKGAMKLTRMLLLTASPSMYVPVRSFLSAQKLNTRVRSPQDRSNFEFTREPTARSICTRTRETAMTSKKVRERSSHSAGLSPTEL